MGKVDLPPVIVLGFGMPHEEFVSSYLDGDAGLGLADELLSSLGRYFADMR